MKNPLISSACFSGSYEVSFLETLYLVSFNTVFLWKKRSTNAWGQIEPKAGAYLEVTKLLFVYQKESIRQRSL